MLALHSANTKRFVSSPNTRLWRAELVLWSKFATSPTTVSIWCLFSHGNRQDSFNLRVNAVKFTLVFRGMGRFSKSGTEYIFYPVLSIEIGLVLASSFRWQGNRPTVISVANKHVWENNSCQQLTRAAQLSACAEAVVQHPGGVNLTQFSNNFVSSAADSPGDAVHHRLLKDPLRKLLKRLKKKETKPNSSY